ncbi:MAG: hypothetical protein JWM60_860 [Solirubrobacterales bacterium]|nr:hypothetical protein [Solirubrobacterales bacterium]
MVIPDWDKGLRPASPRWSEESYLELIEVDLDDADAILGFVSTYGALGMRSGRASNNRLSLAGLSYLDAADQVAEELSEEHMQVAAADELHVGAGETLSEFRWGALCMRDMVSAWRIAQGELDEDTHRWEAPVWKFAKHPVDDVPWESSIGAASLLTIGLSVSVECFAPVVRSELDDDRGLPIFEDMWAYEICCLELFNHIVEQATYRRCANETCDRLFVRQRGRAEQGQYRMHGVKYCSTECARAQAQRQYRRRKAQDL